METKITNCIAAEKAVRDVMYGLDHEEVWGLFLNTDNTVISREMLSKGTLTQTSIDNRTVIKRALMNNANAVIAGLTCVAMAGRNNKYNFWVGYLYNILLFMLFWQRHLYSAMLLQPIAFAINAFGHWRWTHPKEDEKSAGDASALKVSRLDMKGWCVALTVVVAAGAVWGYVLSQLGVRWGVGTFSPDPTPWLDSFVLMLTLLAQFLSAQKKWDCWIVWLVVNIANITLYLSAGLVFMPIVSALYLINGIWSLWTWFKLYRDGK